LSRIKCLASLHVCSFSRILGIYVGFLMEVNTNGRSLVATPVETRGIRPEMTRLTLARKIGPVTFLVWKKGAE
jgi:hypothetical protein